MANIFELNINVNSNEQTETEKALKKTSNAKHQEESDKNGVLSTLKTAAKIAGTVHIGQKVMSNVVTPTFNMGITTIGTIYGDQARANQIQNMATTVETGTSLVKSGLSGYSAGVAIAGKAGGIWGAVLAVALEAVGEVVDMVNIAREYNNKQLDYKYNSAYAQERLGILAANKGR